MDKLLYVLFGCFVTCMALLAILSIWGTFYLLSGKGDKPFFDKVGSLFCIMFLVLLGLTLVFLISFCIVCTIVK